MNLKRQRMVISESDALHLLYKNSNSKMNLDFIDPKNHIKPEEIATEMSMIKTINYPLLRQVVYAVEDGQIIMCDGDAGSSCVFLPAVNSSGQIQKMFVNISRIVTRSNMVDPHTGNIIKKASIVGGHDALYALLLAAYAGLNAKKVYNNPTAITAIRNIYCDMFSHLMSRSFGNPIDGEKFRFLTSHFFFDNEINGMDLAQLLKYKPDQVNAINISTPGWLIDNGSDTLLLSEFIDKVLVKEFPSLSRNKLSASMFVYNSVSMMGDTGIYMLDNLVYLLCAIVAKCRKSKVFSGYILKPIEQDASTTLSIIYKSLI